jgi:pSer/pThr/pTyr-binding forkhead associated (FHA) protein
LAGESVPTSEIPLVPPTAPQVTLVVEDQAGVERRIWCKRLVTLLGSRVGCKIRLNHPKVGGVHAAIVHTGTAAWAIDLVTARGTSLNDLQMHLEQLNDGDVLTIAPWSFTVEVKEPPEDAVPPQVVDLEPAPEVVILEHIQTGRLLKPHREVCTLGRRNGCDIVISDPSISRVQALLFSHFGHPAILDLLSENGLMVNGAPALFRKLRGDDILTIGSAQFRVRLVAHSVDIGGAGNGKPPGTSLELAPAEAEPDLIDIHETENSQPWMIVDHLKKAQRERG